MTNYVSMTDEFIKLSLKSPQDYLTTPYQRKKIMATGRKIYRDPSQLKKIPSRVGGMVRSGLRTGFRGNLLMKGLHGLAVAEPMITGHSLATRPEQFKGRVGKTIGESLGSSLGYLASSRLPVVGAIGASILAGTAGSRIGGMFDRMTKPPKVSPKASR